ncbi:HesA/MoeB/ThiF family protein [Yoonia sediminilitoris]|uniref:Molybdopterin-synthase adenylyltransferase n=1 Tax=Yoonia sediminilitoris TaxID=1286148 RepID=A0A2T6KPS9_9RHOB|nr:molybdopterin-synthase adenylyltransferase MoeB [Yoonia sediminilitoris]PUB18569.1 molybdopterin/thiamine biosynthesis adenylyltransferase [Yoonia sediminilitoris]RCW98737.1 molybdopterin/thiamine biosynthesis adenylyltransferase [Yoonia sediminilitoris]
MIMVGAMAAVLWGIGIAMKAPYHARWTMMGILLVAVMIIHVALPDGHPLRMATGGDARLWGLLIAFGFMVWGYRKFLGGLRRQVAAKAAPAPASSDRFSTTELDRYARHIMLREVGGPGQKAMRDAKVLVVGAGGLGAPALQYLAAAGVGTIGVIDDDTVENTNLQRQVIHLDRNIGMPKVHSAAEAMKAQNPFVVVRPYQRRLEEEIAADLFADYDLILDGTDNFDTRYLVNRTAVALGKPLIAGALTQWEGQISLYAPAQGTPCYECVFPTAPDSALVPSCAEAGVIGPLPGVIGAMMAVEAVKLITGAGDGLGGRMLIYDALYAQTRTINIKPRADCAVCGGQGLRPSE